MIMRRWLFFGGVVFGLSLVLPTGASRLSADVPSYTIQDLGLIDGAVPAVTGINASGAVAGSVNTMNGPRAVVYTDDNGFVYVSGLEAVFSNAVDINDAGVVAGYMQTENGFRAFRTTATGPEAIAPPADGTMTLGLAINEAGVVVGSVSIAGSRAFRAPGTTAELVPTITGGTVNLACGVNESGQVTGMSSNASGIQHAFRTEPDDSVTDLGSLAGANGTSTACAINDMGHVAGRTAVAGSTAMHAFVYTDHMQDIDTLNSAASSGEAISGNTVVGTVATAAGSHAFIYTPEDGMVDLNTRIPSNSGWVLMTAKGINANGQIVGQGSFNGEMRAYRLTPELPTDVTPPSIDAISANPAFIWPPNHKFVPVTVSVSARDDVDPAPVCSITAVTTTGEGAATITGDLTASVRTDKDSVYSLEVTCSDAAGNLSTATTTVAIGKSGNATLLKKALKLKQLGPHGHDRCRVLAFRTHTHHKPAHHKPAPKKHGRH
jgi:probable HAF family extracellular repeat protein